MVRTLIDPVTRIEGHLRIELEVDNNVVTDAWVSGTLFRGFEQIMKDRAPADAYFISQHLWCLPHLACARQRWQPTRRSRS
jgi:hydrogenase large subunit